MAAPRKSRPRLASPSLPRPLRVAMLPHSRQPPADTDDLPPCRAAGAGDTKPIALGDLPAGGRRDSFVDPLALSIRYTPKRFQESHEPRELWAERAAPECVALRCNPEHASD